MSDVLTHRLPSIAERARRLVRALDLVEKGAVKVAGERPGQFKVENAGDGEYVDLRNDDMPCHCADACNRDVVCKHRLAVKLYLADAELRSAVGDLVAVARRR